MCHADTTLLGYRWMDEGPIPQPDPYAAHTCANWKRVQDWAKERTFDYGLLVHPTFGMLELSQGLKQLVPWHPHSSQALDC